MSVLLPIEYMSCLNSGHLYVARLMYGSDNSAAFLLGPCIISVCSVQCCLVFDVLLVDLVIIVLLFIHANRH